MKKLLILISLISIHLHAQNGISFSVLHDGKLGLGLDKKHLNDRPTLDLIINMNWEGKQFQHYYFAIQTQFETANLYDGYFKRYSVHGIWNFNKLILDKLNIGMGVGIGVIHRERTDGLGNYSGTIEISYPIFRDLSIINKNEWVRRPDLATPKLGYNFSIGLKYKPIHL